MTLALLVGASLMVGLVALLVSGVNASTLSFSSPGAQLGNGVIEQLLSANAAVVTTTVPVGSDPFCVAVDPSTDTVYVTNYSGNTVSAIDGATNTVTVTVGGAPAGDGVDPSTDTVYVANADSNTVSVINVATNAVTATITVDSDPEGVGVNLATDTVYVANARSATVSVINGVTNTVTATVTVGGSPIGVGVDPITNTVYVANSRSATVSVIDGVTNTVTATVTVGGFPGEVGVDSSTDTAYIAPAGSNTVSVIDGATNTVTATVTVGSDLEGVGVDPNTSTVYVANYESNTVSVIHIPGGAGTSNTAAQALAQAVQSYLGSVTSPILEVNHRLTDVALVEPSGTAPVTIEILQYYAPRWKVEQRLSPGAPKVPLTLGLHLNAASTNNSLEWFKTLALGTIRPAFAVYVYAATRYHGFVVAKRTSRWEIVPFQVYGRGALPSPVFYSSSRVTTEHDNCTPTCNSGTFTWRLFRFDPTKSSFAQVGPVRTGTPPGGYGPIPPSAGSPTKAPPTAALALPRVYSFGCPADYPAMFEPSEITISCADNNQYLSEITWSSWTATSAQGHGTLYLNDCTPDCAGGTFQTSPTSVTLSDPVRSNSQGLVFSMLTWISLNGATASEGIGPDGCGSFSWYC
jgi:YVTN family beta-propeller protein